MRILLISLLLSITVQLISQDNIVESKVYAWDKLEVEQHENREKRPILKGQTKGMEYFEVHASTLQPGEASHESHLPNDREKMILIKEGELKVAIGDESKVLGKGSMAVFMPGEKHQHYNAGDTPVTYYVILFKAREPFEKELTAKSSFMIDFDELEFHPHDKGGLWDYYRKSTSMFEYAEMHVTKLNGNIKSHEPHTHGAAEIVLMISGNSEMQIGDQFYPGKAGDLYFLESDVSHAIQNTSDEPCMYFAFQWE